MPPHVLALLAAQLGVISRGQALAGGLTAAEVRTIVDGKRWVTVRRGVYADGPTIGAASPEQRHRMLAVAAALAHPAAVVSHGSAALLHGLPWIGRPPAAVHLTAESWGRSRAGLLVHRAPLGDADLAMVAGVRAAALARTVRDVSATESFTVATAVADAALRAGARLEPAFAVRHAARVRRVLEFADGRAESAGESWGRVRIAEAGLPVPVLQWEVVPRGSTGGGIRTDYGWPDHALAGEFDGRAKYGGVDDFWAEREREQRLRDLGIEVVRWTWADLQDFGAVAARLRRAMASRSRRPA